MEYYGSFILLIKRRRYKFKYSSKTENENEEVF